MACFGCICHTCANNVERPGACPEKEEQFCYTCDECSAGYGGPLSHDRWTKECPNYKISERAKEEQARAAEQKAGRRRSALKVVNP